MKKFTKLAALAALATVGSVFAAWQFTGLGRVETEKSEVTINVDQDIYTSGFNGQLVLTHNGNKAVNLVQSGIDALSFKFVDDIATEKQDSFTASYTPGIGEDTSRSAYMIGIRLEVYYDDYKNGDEAFATAFLSDEIYPNSEGVYQYTQTFAELNNQIGTVEFSEINETIASLEDLKEWLDGNPSSKFSMFVTAEIYEAGYLPDPTRPN